MSTAYYTENSHPPELRHMSIDDIADEYVRDIVEGVPGTGVRAGAIGEIGIELEFTPQEERNLRAASRASARTHVPLTVHTSSTVGPLMPTSRSSGIKPSRAKGCSSYMRSAR